MWVKGRRHGGMDEPTKQTDWERWLQDHAPKFLLYARQKTRSEADAQDLVQEAVVEAARHVDNAQPPPVARVFATIHHRAIDLARRDDRRTGRELAAADTQPVAWFDTSVEDRERQQLIQDAMSQLPVIYREVITLKVWGELTFAEIADTLGIPANTAASRYRYGLAELRQMTREVFA